MELTNGTILTNRKVLTINHKEFRKTFMKRLALAQITTSTVYTTMDKVKVRLLKMVTNIFYGLCIILIASLVYF